MCQSYVGDDRLDLTSWVPDWTLKSGPRPLLYDTYGHGPGLADLKCEKVDIQVNEKRDMLLVYGARVDTVRALRQAMDEVKDISPCLADWASILQPRLPDLGPHREVAERYAAAMEQMSLASKAPPQTGA